MPSDGGRAALNDIADHIAFAQELIGDFDEAAFAADRRTLYAVARCLEIISEASRRLPEDIRARHTDIAWRNMAAAGNIYRHEYEAVLPSAIWNTVIYALPQLSRAVEQELARLGA